MYVHPFFKTKTVENLWRFLWITVDNSCGLVHNHMKSVIPKETHMRGIATERRMLYPAQAWRILKETSDVVDNFVDKPVDNKGITVENMWKRGIKALAPKRKSKRCR